MQKLLLTEQRRALQANYRWNAVRIGKGEDTADLKPVVKLFTPWGGATWLFSELSTEDNDQLFGLCDPGLGSPELGYASLNEIAGVRGPGGLRIERDMHARLDKPLSFYAQAAQLARRITV